MHLQYLPVQNTPCHPPKYYHKNWPDLTGETDPVRQTLSSHHLSVNEVTKVVTGVYRWKQCHWGELL